VILGRTGSGKSFTLNFLITNLQKYDPYTFIFDLGGSFEHLTRLFEGSYVKVGPHSAAFKINPFCLPKTKSNLDFLALFVQVLADNHGGERLSLEEEQELYQQIENLYSVDPELRTLGVLANTLPRDLSLKLHKWTSGGQFGFLFDNAEDTVSFSRFQCFDFQGMEQYHRFLSRSCSTSSIARTTSSPTAKSRTSSRHSSSMKLGPFFEIRASRATSWKR